MKTARMSVAGLLVLVVQMVLPVSAEELTPARIVVDRAEFVERLPARVYVRETAHDVADEKPARRTVLAGLKSARGRFHLLPERGVSAKAVTTSAPRYPFDLRREGAEGVARFLLLIAADGKVEAVYCYQRSHTLFEEAAAEALVRWQFAPARVDGACVPMLVDQSISFNLQQSAQTGPSP